MLEITKHPVGIQEDAFLMETSVQKQLIMISFADSFYQFR
jgi:hypothetical protein